MNKLKNKLSKNCVIIGNFFLHRGNYDRFEYDSILEKIKEIESEFGKCINVQNSHCNSETGFVYVILFFEKHNAYFKIIGLKNNGTIHWDSNIIEVNGVYTNPNIIISLMEQHKISSMVWSWENCPLEEKWKLKSKNNPNIILSKTINEKGVYFDKGYTLDILKID